MVAFTWAVAVLTGLGALAVAMDVPQFFPTVEGLLTDVTWAHAVNSQGTLKKVLESKVMMIESDVSSGSLIVDGKIEEEDIPIMAHPPDNSSDLSLEQLLTRLIEDDRTGIKLDFKTLEVFQKSIDILAKHDAAMKFPVWLNADILPGPVNSTAIPVDADTFLSQSRDNFPNRTLSVGWTTRYDSNVTGGSYLPQHVAAMRDALQRHNISQPVTFPVRASLAARSASVLLPLLEAVPNSTLTIWGTSADDVDDDLLKELVITAGKTRVYLDLPGPIIGLQADTNSAETTVRGLPLLLAAVLAAVGLALLGRLNL